MGGREWWEGAVSDKDIITYPSVSQLNILTRSEMNDK